MANQKSGRKPSKSTKSTKKTKSKSKGLGDTVEQVLEVTGIAKVAKWALGEDCGCDKRKEILNHLFPYNKPECLNEQEYAYLKAFYSNNGNTISPTIQQELIDIYNRVFRERVNPTSCSSCFVNKVHNKLKRVFEEYKDE